MKIAIISRDPKLYSISRSRDQLRSMPLLANKGIEKTTGKNVAGTIIDFIAKKAKPVRARTRGQG